MKGSSQMTNRTLFKTIVLTSVVVLVALIGLQGSFDRVDATTPPLKVQEQDAVERAMDMARLRGLKETTPTRFAVKQMTLAEYYKLSNVEAGSDAAKFGLDPDLQVWVVTIRGEVAWAGPGRTGGDGDKFDNITIVINAQTGEHVATLSARAGQPLPLDVP
jgi:hypothetical protein